ncbi:MAG TPA: DegT/DnrJ/EryC1/StrS aminotransferase family protein [bacterium]|nr:DegT/DnrJ/EryC1/StrS aminotransferase family protein [bacterium]
MLPLTKPFFDDDDFRALNDALRSTFVSGDGPECRAFEQELAAYLGVRHAFFTTSCTAALDLAFLVKGLPQGAEVIVPDFTFTSSALAAIMNGLKVVLADVRADNGNLDMRQLEAKITSRTAAVVSVDYAGNPAEMDELLRVAGRHGLYVVSDSAQSIGATYKDRKIGALCDVTCFSFHGTKNLVVGEGGAIVTNDDEVADRIIVAREKGTDKHRFLSNPTMKGYYEYIGRGNSYVQSNLLGALGRSQLKKLDLMNARRREIAAFYQRELGGIDGLRLPSITDGAVPNWHLFYVLVDGSFKEALIDGLRAERIGANIHYHPLHINRYYREVCSFEDTEFPNATAFFNGLVRLPLYFGMSDTDTRDVVDAVHAVMAVHVRAGRV